MDLKSRIKQLCNYLNVSIREFERECQLHRGNISNMTGALGSDKLAKIIDRHPGLNLHWLLTGEGEMFAFRDPDPPKFHPSLPQKNITDKSATAALGELIRLQRQALCLQQKQLRQLESLLEKLEEKH